MQMRRKPVPPSPLRPMTDFLRDLLSRPGAARTVIVLEPDSMSAPRQYEVRPGAAVYAVVIAVVVGAAVIVAAAVLTPLRGVLLGPGTAEVRTAAERSAVRAEALEDSLAVQAEQIELLRALITGEGGPDAPASDAPAADVPAADVPADAESDPARNASDGEAVASETPAPGAVAPARAAGSDAAPLRLAAPAEAYLAGLRAPALPPLDGLVSRGFLPARGHFGLDLATDAGTPVLAVADGTVVLADWTQDGGLTVAVQHTGGYLSVYKHNSRVGRRVGDAVRAREALALSGNTGRVSSGPHLHVEVWRDGRALDPAAFFLLR